MPRATSELYVPIESPATTSSTGTGDIKTITPANNKRAVGVWVTAETTAARITFDNTAPGAGAGPGILIPTNAAPVFFPFPINATTPIKFASNAAAASALSVIFVQ